MRKGFLFLILVSLSFGLAAQESLSETDKLASLCRVWGFLKFYHPAVAGGKYDWDQELLNREPLLLSLKTKEELSTFYLKWIRSLGSLASYPVSAFDPAPGSITRNLDQLWMNDSTVFTDSLSAVFKNIVKHRHIGKSNYVREFPIIGGVDLVHGETLAVVSPYPTPEIRLLGLFRYWNTVFYYYPYKYSIGMDWNQELVQMIPKFRGAADTLQYHLAMLELSLSINDSHASFTSNYIDRYWGTKTPPFKFKMVEGKLIVTGFYDEALARCDDIRVGDVIQFLEGKPVEDFIIRKSKYISGSNAAAKNRNFRLVLLNGQTDSLRVTVIRNNISTEKSIHRYLPSFFKTAPAEKTSWKLLDPTTGYVNMGNLNRRQVPKMMRMMAKTEWLILDLRHYPNNTYPKVAEYLNTEKKAFASLMDPDYTYPGVFKKRGEVYCEKTNKSPYKGKVIVLMDEYTQSQGEFSCMAFQTAPHVIIIGSQTSGADGDMVFFAFPGPYKAYMTGMGVYYPDWKETQHVGIKADIAVQPSLDGMSNGKDEILDRALQYIKEQNK